MQFYVPGLIIIAGFLGLGVFLLVREVAFKSDQAAATAHVVSRYFSFDNTQTGNGFFEFLLVCEIRPGQMNQTYRGNVEINFISWCSTKDGQEIDVWYKRSNPTNMRLSRSLGDWPACIFLFSGGLIGLFFVLKGIAGHLKKELESRI